MTRLIRRTYRRTLRTIVPKIRFYRRSLRVHALLALGIIVAAATLMVAIGIGGFVFRTEQLSWQDRQREAVRYAGRTLDDFVDNIERFMTTVSLLDENYLQQDPNYLYQLLRQNPALLEVIRLNYDGQVIAGAYQGSHPVLSNLFTIPQSNWFLKARLGQTYAGELQISANNEPYLILAIPAANHGVVAARLSMNALWQMVEDLRFGLTGRVYVLDQNNNLIAFPDHSEYVLQRTNLGEQAEVRTALLYPDHAWTGEYDNFQGERVLGSTRLIKKVQWTVIAETNTSETNAATRRAFWMLGIISVLFSLLLLLASDVSMRRILFRPIEEMRDGAIRVGQGDLDQRLNTKRHDELGELAIAFNEMAANLKQREDALAQARDAAQSASQFKSRLLANVSHDLRTPLSAILGYADILKEQVYGPLTERQSTAVQRVLANTQRLLELVNSLLDQAQIESGRLEWDIVSFCPADLLVEMQNVMGVLAQQKGLQLLTHLDPEMPGVVKGDQRRVYQILTNLVSNAVKFTDRGWVRVSFRPDGSFWVIEVADTGRGIAEQALPYIFDPFHQVDGSTTRRERGVGLGLSIVQQLSMLMGGHVQVKSQIGQGSTFIVFLPVEQQGIVSELEEGKE